MRKLMIYSLISFLLEFINAQNYNNLPWIDLSSKKELHFIIAEGNENLYNGHPTTTLLGDGKTLLCTWSLGHGGKAAFIASSNDGGFTWNSQKTPYDWQRMSNCPSIYKMVDKKGKERLFVFCQEPLMGYSYSEDNGQTWSKVKSLNKPCVMVEKSEHVVTA